MSLRLLDYHSYLHRKYALPVLSIIVYPFRTQMATSPLVETSGDMQLLIFHFRVFPLWELNAEQTVCKGLRAVHLCFIANDGRGKRNAVEHSYRRDGRIL